MAEWRTSRDMIEQVLQMYSEGRKIRAIERCTNLCWRVAAWKLRKYTITTKGDSY
jgi:transposase-like protein